jgi:hypothetical protein
MEPVIWILYSRISHGKARHSQASFSKTLMNEVMSVPIGDCESTLSFPSEETSLGSGLPSHLL